MPRPRLANRILGPRYGRIRCRLLPLFLPPVVYRRCLRQMLDGHRVG